VSGSASLAEERVARARKAQARWAAQSVAERAKRLRPLRTALAARMGDFIAVMGEEVGKPPMDVVAGDMMVTLEQLRFYEQHAAELLRVRRVGQPPFFYSGARFVEVPEPFGVVLVLAPWNYPVQLGVIPAATALFAGNAVLLKCSEKVPRTAALLGEVCAAAAVDPDLFQVSCDEPAEAAQLVNARPDLLFFTGSTEVGRAVAQRAAALLVPAVLELGGKDAAIVFRSAQLPRAARGLAYGAFSNNGQVCISTRRILLDAEIEPSFVPAFLAEVEKLRLGRDLGPLRVEGVEARVREQIASAVAEGAEVLHGWPAPEGELGPVVLRHVSARSRLLTEEVFGPVVILSSFADEQQAVAEANSSPWALSASVWTGDRRQAVRVAKALASGSCAVNDVIRNIANPQAAFGGNGASGWGRYHGPEGLRTFSRTKTIMLMHGKRTREIHWFPFSSRLQRMMEGLMQFRHGTGSIGRRLSSLMRSAAMVALVCGVFAARANAQDGDLTIDVKLPPGAHGSLAYLVFQSAEGFPDARDHALRHAFVPVSAKDGEQTIDVGPLAPAQYAVTVYLDANGNGKLDKGFLGIPKEPVGASNNPKGRMGPPSYSECAFEHGSTPQQIQVTLVH
jgi:4,4'-diapolycopenoate synthase